MHAALRICRPPGIRWSACTSSVSRCAWQGRVASVRSIRAVMLPTKAGPASFSTAAASAAQLMSSAAHSTHTAAAPTELPSGWVRCFVGVGCNIGHRARNLHAALALLQSVQPDRLCLHATSFLYESTPVGSPPEHQAQPRFLNAVLEVHTQLQPLELLEQLKEIEQRMGRDAQMVRNGPRIIDLDILRQLTSSILQLASKIRQSSACAHSVCIGAACV